MADELVILCEECGQKNRIKLGQNASYAKCGKCGTPLEVQKPSSNGIGLVFFLALVVFAGYLFFEDKSNVIIKPIKTAAISKPRPEFNAPPVKIKAGILRSRFDRKAIAKFQIKTTAGSDYFIKIVNQSTDEEELVVYINGGKSFLTEIPLGNYSMRYATGTTWYGENLLFGPQTTFAKANKNFIFKREGNQILGYTIELIPQVGGNLRTSKITRSQF